jgi:hypothetical protein
MIRRGVGRVGRPGLVGTVARTAVVAGTATAVSGGMMRHQAQKDEARAQQEYAEQQAAYAQQAAAPAAAPPTADDKFEQLEKIADLKERGILNDQEFEAEKRRILGS